MGRERTTVRFPERRATSMSEWTEDASRTFLSIASAAVPRRHEQMATLLALIPFQRAEPFRILELGAGDGRLAAALLELFPRATVLALDGSPLMRAAATKRMEPFADRARVAPFALDTIDLVGGDRRDRRRHRHADPAPPQCGQDAGSCTKRLRIAFPRAAHC